MQLKKKFITVIIYLLAFSKLSLSIGENGDIAVIRSIFKSLSSSPTKDQFKAFHYLYNRAYDLNSDEGLMRYRIFKSNLKYIQESNSKNLGYYLSINKFADISEEEYKSLFIKKEKSFDHDLNSTSGNDIDFFDKYADADDTELEADSDDFEISWEKYQHKTRDQEYCGCCWAFASLGTVTMNYYIKFGILLKDLSPQHSVDCDVENDGCEGGFPSQIFPSLMKYGVTYEEFYPYVVGNKKVLREECKKDVPRFKIVSGYDSGRGKGEVYFNKLIKQGPVYVSMDASPKPFIHYGGGPIDMDCNSEGPNHAVIIIGLVKENGKKYFLIKNSYGRDWGENGVMKLLIKRQNNNGCFILNSAILPIVQQINIPDPPEPKPDKKCILLFNSCNPYEANKAEICGSSQRLPIDVPKQFLVDLGSMQGKKVSFFSEENCDGNRITHDSVPTCYQSRIKSVAFIPQIEIKPNCIYAFENGCLFGKYIEICSLTKYKFNEFKVGSLILGSQVDFVRLYDYGNSIIKIREKYTYSIFNVFYQKVSSAEINYVMPN